MEIFGRQKDFIRARYFRLRESLSPTHIRSPHEIPIIINSFNRCTTLAALIASLEKRGLHNIVILDNDSTYPPLLEYYETLPYKVKYLRRNLGFKALWRDREVRREFCSDYYIYTDSDVVLGDDCPSDIVERMFHLLHDCYKNAFKIGPSIRIDNLPDSYDRKREVIEWESRFRQNPNADGLCRAPIDTTFALYRPRIGLSRRVSLESYRMEPPYEIEHLPWYVDSQNIDPEEAYYRSMCSHPTAWSNK